MCSKRRREELLIIKKTEFKPTSEQRRVLRSPLSMKYFTYTTVEHHLTPSLHTENGWTDRRRVTRMGDDDVDDCDVH